jgi:hypothetical protein
VLELQLFSDSYLLRTGCLECSGPNWCISINHCRLVRSRTTSSSFLLFFRMCSGGLDRIAGKWGSVESVPFGIFNLQKKFVEYFRIFPSEENDGKKKLRLSCKFAIEATLHRLSPRTICCSVLKKRRDQRRQFIALFKWSQSVGLNESDAAELRTLESTLLIADFTSIKGSYR